VKRTLTKSDAGEDKIFEEKGYAEPTAVHSGHSLRTSIRYGKITCSRVRPPPACQRESEEKKVTASLAEGIQSKW
jgi:hypothetical protein